MATEVVTRVSDLLLCAGTKVCYLLDLSEWGVGTVISCVIMQSSHLIRSDPVIWLIRSLKQDDTNEKVKQHCFHWSRRLSLRDSRFSQRQTSTTTLYCAPHLRIQSHPNVIEKEKGEDGANL
ncbi:hypothetical protein BT69DRAFT_659899 [Atractiella rhizophila]|nr:hypothetical protein BT69DRAFT_659899 [Atractiella rhizophila]